ncbi:phage major capsid protein [Actinomadura sp. NPDC049753]|uniref:phage major capsid protein n=1 Tax=Actinomadura sp. NPDC049753 TaxID=3154739 RepID=UPI00342314BD
MPGRVEFLRGRVNELLEKRKTAKEALAAVMEKPTAEERKLTPDETRAFKEREAEIQGIDTELETLQSELSSTEELERREQAANELRAKYGAVAPSGPEQRVKVTSEPETYRRGGPNSYFRDLTRAHLHGSRESVERLARNDREVMEKRALTTTDGAGGEFVPPAWMVDEYVRLARAGRTSANLLRSAPLPPGTDSINLPRLATGTAVAEQATQNTSVQNTDATTASVTANVATIAGQQVVAVQLIEQSPINVDEILLADLAADYAVKLDVFALNNNAAGKRGLLNVTGVNAVTYTDATPTVAEAYAKLADAIQQVHTGRYLPPSHVIMHPRRWAWMLAAVDAQGRPFVVPAAQAPMNSAGSAAPVASEGYVGTLQGLPVYVDPNIPINLGAGTNEDRIIVVRADDVILFESTPRSEAFRETKADQLSVLLRFYNYVALHSERYPKSISVISGTGLITPTF